MATHDSSGRLEFEYTSKQPAKGGKTKGGDRFRILILGDFSGRDSRGMAENNLAARRPLRVDAENLDQVLAKCGTQVHLPFGYGSCLPVPIGTLDDFHPDRLFAAVPIFASLRDLHQRLQNPATFPAAAAQVRALVGTESPPAAPTPAPQSAPQPDNPFAALLGQTLGAPAQPQPTPAEAFIRSVVAPYAVSGTDPQQAELTRLVEAALAAGMRALLHHPAFQALEAAWRSVHFLVSRLTTDENLQVFLLDVSKSELAADLGGGELEQSGMHRLLIDQASGTQGGEPWALLVGNYTFDQEADDVKLLARMATLAAAAEAPFIAGATPSVVGCPTFSAPGANDPDTWQTPPGLDLWNKLRALDQTAYLGLTTPRFLLRLPYGPQTDPTETYHFEELPPAEPAAHHAQYLWGNAAFAVAYLLGNGFLEESWAFSPGTWLEIGEIPAHLFTEDGSKTMKPCAEAFLPDRAAEKILELGVIPVLSIKGRDAVRVVGLTSMAQDGTTLQGRWA